MKWWKCHVRWPVGSVGAADVYFAVLAKDKSGAEQAASDWVGAQIPSTDENNFTTWVREAPEYVPDLKNEWWEEPPPLDGAADEDDEDDEDDEYEE